jgi:hypothetical protein
MVRAEAARRFLVAHHLLAPARSLEGGSDAVLEVFRERARWMAAFALEDLTGRRSFRNI